MVEKFLDLARINRWICFGFLSLVGFCGFLTVVSEASGHKSSYGEIQKLRPPNLVVLIQKPGLGGDYVLGIYGIEIDQNDPNLRRYKIWEEWSYDLKVRSETVRCNPEGPLRVKRDSKSIYVRRLNPGGLINSANQEDHLVWWAACVPEMAGIDPSTLKGKALSLGFSTGLVENQEILTLPSR